MKKILLMAALAGLLGCQVKPTLFSDQIAPGPAVSSGGTADLIVLNFRDMRQGDNRGGTWWLAYIPCWLWATQTYERPEAWIRAKSSPQYSLSTDLPNAVRIDLMAAGLFGKIDFDPNLDARSAQAAGASYAYALDGEILELVWRRHFTMYGCSFAAWPFQLCGMPLSFGSVSLRLKFRLRRLADQQVVFSREYVADRGGKMDNFFYNYLGSTQYVELLEDVLRDFRWDLQSALKNQSSAPEKPAAAPVAPELRSDTAPDADAGGDADDDVRDPFGDPTPGSN